MQRYGVYLADVQIAIAHSGSDEVVFAAFIAIRCKAETESTMRATSLKHAVQPLRKVTAQS